MRARACRAVRPPSSGHSAAPGPVSQLGVSSCSLPSRRSTDRTGRLSSRHQMMSVVSPNVQIIAMPVPLSGSASRCARTGTPTPNSGVVTVVPNSGR